MYSPMDVYQGVAYIMHRWRSRPQARVYMSILYPSNYGVQELLSRSNNKFHSLVVVRVGLETYGRITFSRARRGPQVRLGTTMAMFTNIFSTEVIFINTVSSTVRILGHVFMKRNARSARAIAFRRGLQLNRRIRATFGRRNGHRESSQAPLNDVTKVRPRYRWDTATCRRTGV